MGQNVGFVGYECEDIALYLGAVLTGLGKKTIIIDRTEQELLIEMFGCEGEFAGVRMTNQGVSGEDFDFVFFLFGYRLRHPKLYECELLVMVTDGVPAHASLLRKIGQWERKQCLLIRNLIPMRHTEQYLAMLAGNEESYFGLPLEEADIRGKYCLGAYAECNFRKVSTAMQKGLVYLTHFLLPEMDEQEIKKICRGKELLKQAL